MNPAESETEKLEASADKGKMKGGRVDQDKSLCYACNICGKSFPFQSSLSQHMRKHTGERPYKCPYCEHRASQKGSLKLHIRSHKLGTLSHGHEEADGELGEAGVSEGLGACASPTESTSACNGVLHDSTKDDDREKIKSTKRDKGTLRCLLCKRKLGSREELERHAQLHKPYRCRLCSFVAMREDQLLGHIEKTHITVEAAMPQEVDEVVGSGEQSEGHFPCKLCDKIFAQAWLLKAHMKKHLASLEHRCHVCGRRFREAWFLRSHMKTHGSRAGGRGKTKGDSEPAATINNVVQDETSMFNGLCLFELCSRCGNLFHDQESLQVHKRVHSYAHRINGKRPYNRRKSDDDTDSQSAKKLFMEGLNLKPAAAQEIPAEEMLGKRIPELDPVCSYQAWQLATKGRVAEISDASRYLGWDEALEDADVAYDEEKGEYVALGPEKGRQELGSNSSASGQRRRSSGSSARHQHRSSSGSSCQPSTACNGEVSPERVSDTEYRPPSRQSRRGSQGKSAECFECGRVFRTHHQMVLHSRMHRRDARASGESRGQGERLGSASEAESGSASCPSTPGYEDSPPSTVGEDTAGDAALDKKPYICNRCNVVTTDLSSWLSHVKNHHQESSVLKPNQVDSKSAEGEGGLPLSSVGVEGADFPKLRKALLQEPPAVSSSKGGAAGSIAEMQNGSRTRGKMDSVPLNLTVQCGSQPPGAGTRLQGALVTHQCASCSFATRYPEVLWIHQRVYHKASNSTPVAQWTPKRRTGPPPALDGQECPPLPTTRVPRTRPPAPGTSRKSRSGESSSSSSSTHHGRDCSSVARAMPSGPPLHPTKKHKAGKHTAEEVPQSRPRVKLYPRVDRAATLEKGAVGGPRQSGSPKGNSQMERFTFPREGLGFMLSSKHVLSEYARGASLSSLQPVPGRTHSQQESHAPRHGLDQQAAWSRSSALLDPPPFLSQVKKELSTDAANPAGGILSFLKNCNSHGLSSLYQHWGAPPGATLDHTGIPRSLVRQEDYPCQECGKSFGQPSHLRTHMRSHTGERPFQCQHCPYSSTQKGNLKTHVQSVHRLAFDSRLQQGRPRPPSQPAEDPPDGSLQDHSVPEATVLD